MLAHDIALALDPCLLMQEAGMEPDPWQESFLRSSSDRQLLLCTRQAGKRPFGKGFQLAVRYDSSSGCGPSRAAAGWPRSPRRRSAIRPT